MIRRLLDSWTVRRLLWPMCAMRDHPLEFEIDRLLDGVPFATVRRCTCGVRTVESAR